jgi:hypothetical protein
MVRVLKNAMVTLVLLSLDLVCAVAQSSQPDPARLASMMLAEKSSGDVEDSPYLNYLNTLGFMKSDSDMTLGILRQDEIFHKKVLVRILFKLKSEP